MGLTIEDLVMIMLALTVLALIFALLVSETSRHLRHARRNQLSDQAFHAGTLGRRE